jgi:uncharacterized protein
MHVIITGGTGFIGQALTQDLVRDGHQVTILSRSPGSAAGLAGGGVQFRKWDAQTAQGWQDAVESADVIINFAGETIGGERFLPDRWTSKKKKHIRSSRLNAGRAVTEAIAAANRKPKLLVQASAIGYYGPRDDDTKLSEDAPAGNDFLASIGQEWEAATQAAEALGVRRVIARTGLILATETGPLPRLLPFFKAFVGGPFGSGRQWWSWIHLQDEIRALRFLMDNETASGPFNLVAPQPVTNREFSKTLGQVLHRPSLIPVPGLAVKLLVGEVATIVLDGQRVVPTRLQEMGFTFNYPSLDAALKDVLNG